MKNNAHNEIFVHMYSSLIVVSQSLPMESMSQDFFVLHNQDATEM